LLRGCARPIKPSPVAEVIDPRFIIGTLLRLTQSFSPIERILRQPQVNAARAMNG
jgi:hypothetical protein